MSYGPLAVSGPELITYNHITPQQRNRGFDAKEKAEEK
jgi:hypothetical protein